VLQLTNAVIPTAEAMAAVGGQLAAQLHPGDVLALHGDLGAGKTTLVRGIATALGVSPDDVASPTFALAHLYHGRDFDLLHADLYRVEDPAELEEAGLIEQLLDPERLVIVEWPEVASDVLPATTLHVRIDTRPEGRCLVLLAR
jgi:tRNA threonylcarbamoyl adenosine modification protein YjeE